MARLRHACPMLRLPWPVDPSTEGQRHPDKSPGLRASRRTTDERTPPSDSQTTPGCGLSPRRALAHRRRSARSAGGSATAPRLFDELGPPVPAAAAQANLRLLPDLWYARARETPLRSTSSRTTPCPPPGCDRNRASVGFARAVTASAAAADPADPEDRLTEFAHPTGAAARLSVQQLMLERVAAAPSVRSYGSTTSP
jgi:hypothetical protein